MMLYDVKTINLSVIEGVAMALQDKIKRRIKEFEDKIPRNMEDYDDIEREIKILLEQLSHVGDAE